MVYILIKKAFTLIELLIVIVIISILSISLIPRLKGLQDKAKYMRVEKDFQDFRTAVYMAQTNTNLKLKDITVSACSECACKLPAGGYRDIDARKIPEDDPCRTRRQLSLRRIEVAAGMDWGALVSMDTDPRGSPYYLDENEGEHGSTGCSSFDRITSVGPDGSMIRSSDNRNLIPRPIDCEGGY